jgi:hypothetical protein
MRIDHLGRGRRASAPELVTKEMPVRDAGTRVKVGGTELHVALGRG